MAEHHIAHDDPTIFTPDTLHVTLIQARGLRALEGEGHRQELDDANGDRRIGGPQPRAGDGD